MLLTRNDKKIDSQALHRSGNIGSCERPYGLDSQPDPVEFGDEVICGEEVAGKFVISGGDASPILDAAEEVFDLVPAAIDGLRAIGFLGSVAAASPPYSLARGWRRGCYVLLGGAGLMGRDDRRPEALSL
jgi:hypothetical protein